MCRDVFRVEARALGLFFDQMINTFDPDALIVGGGVAETPARLCSGAVHRWKLPSMSICMAMPKCYGNHCEHMVWAVPSPTVSMLRCPFFLQLKCVDDGKLLIL